MAGQLRTGIVEGPVIGDRLQATHLAEACHGCLVSFLGVVRNEHHGRGVSHIVYDCYRAMAEMILPALATTARAAHDPQAAIEAWHGTGHHDLGDAALVLHVAAAHRGAGFAICQQLVDAIKRDLPVWKHEFYTDGGSAWLEGS